MLTLEKIIAQKHNRDSHKESGIYFLIENNEIVYVGQSVNILSRVNSHNTQSRARNYDSWFFEKHDPAYLDKIETEYIQKFKPKYNLRRDGKSYTSPDSNYFKWLDYVEEKGGGFGAHNINHSSPSSINMWANAPCAWVAKYLLGAKFKFSNAALAGTLVEDAVAAVIARGMAAEDAINAAKADYAKATAIAASDADRKRGDAIQGMIENALEALKEYGEPEEAKDIVFGGKKQKKVEMVCKGDGYELPVIGYLDFYFPKHGLVVDLKTTMAAPSNMSDEHIRQGAFYRGAMGNVAVKFLYVTGKKFVWHEVENHAPVLAEFKTLLNRQERFLSLGDANKLKEVVPLNMASYYWSNDETLRKELYGI